jgi:hypothetical protein
MTVYSAGMFFDMPRIAVIGCQSGAWAAYVLFQDDQYTLVTLAGKSSLVEAVSGVSPLSLELNALNKRP